MGPPAGGRRSTTIDFLVGGGVPSYVTFTRASSATYFDSTGTLQTAGNDVPRFDYDPSTLALRGLLMEQASTNSIRNSTMQGAGVGVAPTSWSVNSASGISPTIIGAGTINGKAYVDIRWSGTASATSGTGCRFDGNSPSIVAASGQTWTNSFEIALVGGSTTGINSVFVGIAENQGSTVLGSTNSSNIRTLLTSTLTRYSATRTFNQATTDRANPNFSFDYTNGAVIDATFRFAIPQCEQLAFATSYIPTTTAAATRAVETLTMSAANVANYFPTFATEGTIVAEFTTYNTTGTPQVLYTISDGTTNNRLQQFYTATGTTLASRIVTAATAASPSNVGTVAANTVYKAGMAFAIGTNQAISALNGTLSTAASPASLPSLATYTDGLRLGGQPAAIGTSQPALYLRRFTVFPRRLTDAELQALCT